MSKSLPCGYLLPGILGQRPLWKPPSINETPKYAGVCASKVRVEQKWATGMQMMAGHFIYLVFFILEWGNHWCPHVIEHVLIPEDKS